MQKDTYLNLPGPDLGTVLLIVIGIAFIVFILLVARMISQRTQEKKVKSSSWDAFYRLSKVRGLDDRQTELLRMIVRRAMLKRPTSILGSIAVFDQCISQVYGQTGEDDKNTALLDEIQEIRKRLLASAAPEKKQVRQLTRVDVDVPVRFRRIGRARPDEERPEIIDDSAPSELPELEPPQEHELEEGYLYDLSAGGGAILCVEQIDVGEFLELRSDPNSGLSLNGVVAEVVRREEHQEEGYSLHLRFTAYPEGGRVEIIKYVHRINRGEKSESAAGLDEEAE